MRLKPAGILVIVLIIILLGYFALKPRLDEIRKENGQEISTTKPSENNGNGQGENQSNTTTTKKCIRY